MEIVKYVRVLTRMGASIKMLKKRTIRTTYEVVSLSLSCTVFNRLVISSQANKREVIDECTKRSVRDDAAGLDTEDELTNKHVKIDVIINVTIAPPPIDRRHHRHHRHRRHCL